ncbi:MAG TPA: hypothetical protein VFE37_13060 [Chloroflexota bacterium]|nr:hypothetical protein [Chloroflexota bacterium]
MDSRYGRAPAALVSTHITYHSRSAVRDVGKALGLPPDALDRRARQLERPRPHPPAPLPCQRRRGWLGGRRSASCLWSGGGSPRRLPRALPLL